MANLSAWHAAQITVERFDVEKRLRGQRSEPSRNAYPHPHKAHKNDENDGALVLLQLSGHHP